MAVNENIYGLKTQWQRYPYDSAWSAVDDIDECIRVAYFGNYEPRYQTLANGAASGMIDKSVPLDKSISYCGLGTESAYSHVKYYSNATLEPLVNGETITPFFTDERTITNFAFMFGDIANGSGYGQSGGRYNTTDSACRYYPDADVEYDYNNNRALTPITSFKFTNFILLIRVKCCRGLDPNDAYYFNPNNGADYTLYDYINTSAHSDYPYVYCVYVVPYCHSDTTNRTPYPNVQRGNGIAILDSYDGATDSNLQQPLYSYYYGQTGYSDTAFKIHGMLTGGGTQQSMQYHASAEETELGYLAICPDTWSAFKYRTYGSYICMGVWREYDNTFWDECMEAVACFGCFFTDKIEIAQSGDLTSNDMYCGTLEKGIGHGKYTHGNDNADQPQFTADTNETEYDPYNPPSDTDTPYEGKTTRIKAGDPIAVGGKWYCDDNLSVWSGLLSWCSGLNMDDSNKQQYFFGQNPIDCILESKVLFVSDYRFGKDIVNERIPIQLGSYIDQGGVGAFPFSRSKPTTFYCGKVTINKIYGDFRDLSPFTTYTLILPFASSVELPSDLVVGHTIYLEETIDPQSGDLKYHISIDNIDYMSANGNCAINLSINGLEIATYQQSRYDLQTQVQTSELNAMASLVGGASGSLIANSYENVAGALMQLGGGFINAANSYNTARRTENKMDRMKPPPAKIQLSTSNVEWGDTVFPCVIASSPRMIAGYNQSEYKAKMGFATYTVATIGSQEGCVVCENVVLSGFKCSDSEQTRIKQMLEAGVYIKK